MPSRPHSPSKWQPFALAAALLFCTGSLHSTFAQFLPGESVSRLNSAPNPETNVRRSSGKRPDNRARQSSINLPQSPANAPLGDKQQAIEQAIEQGNQSRGENNYEQALDHYQKAQTLSPKEARAFYGMGNLYSDLYCHDSAIEAYLNALKFRKDYLEALIGLGYAYAGKERYDDAETQLRAAVKLKPNSADANIGLGRIYLVKGKYQEAITQINLVINSKPVEDKDRAAAHVALGDVYWKQEKRQDAIAQFEEAIRLKPDLAGAYIELGNAQASIAFSKLSAFTSVNEVNMQDLEALRASEKQAVANLEDAKKHGYNHPNLHEYTSLALAYQFRYEDAISQLNDYFEEVNIVETRTSSQVTKCSTGFDHLKADGYGYLGHVYYIEGIFEPDARQKNEFFNKALDQFNQAIKLKEDFAGAYLMRGIIYGYQKNHEEAVKQFNKAILFSTEEPIRTSLYNGIGLAYLNLGHYDDAVDSVQEAIKRDPNNPSYYESLAVIYVRQGKPEDGLAQLKKAAELRKGAFTDPNPYFLVGTTYLNKFMKNGSEEDFNEAIKALKEIVKIRPKFALAYQALGNAYLNHSNADEALANFNKAKECDPKEPANYLNIARVYFELKHNEDAAISYFKKAIELKPDYAEAYSQWGSLYFVRFTKNGSEGDFNEAIKALKEAVKIRPDLADAYYTLGAIYDVRFVRNRKEEDFNESIKALKEVVKVRPEFALAYQGLGLAYQSHSNADEALANFNRAIEYDRKNPANYFNMARVYLELKHDDDAAIKQLLQAIEVDPKHLDAYSNLAEIYKGQKKYPEAIKYLTTAIGIAPTVPWTYKDLAKVYEAQGKNEDAVHYYEEALNRLSADDTYSKNLYLGRIARLQGRYAEATSYFQKLSSPDDPGRTNYEIGLIFIANKNKRAAQEQYQQLVQLKSSLAEELQKKIKEIK
jgi:tetratricopeptide (TPR) repeat protein